MKLFKQAAGAWRRHQVPEQTPWEEAAAFKHLKVLRAEEARLLEALVAAWGSLDFVEGHPWPEAALQRVLDLGASYCKRLEAVSQEHLRLVALLRREQEEQAAAAYAEALEATRAATPQELTVTPAVAYDGPPKGGDAHE